MWRPFCIRRAYVLARVFNFVCLTLVVQRAWAIDKMGIVTKVGGETITIVTATAGASGDLPVEYSITFSPSVRFLHIDPVKAALPFKVWHTANAAWKFPAELKTAESIELKNISIGDTLLVRGDSTGTKEPNGSDSFLKGKGVPTVKLLATVILDVGPNFPVFHRHGTMRGGNGVLSVKGGIVEYSEPDKPDHKFTISCSSFSTGLKRTPGGFGYYDFADLRLIVGTEQYYFGYMFHYPGISRAVENAESSFKQSCKAALAKEAKLVADGESRHKEAERIKRQAEDERRAADERLAEASRDVDFRDKVLVVLNSADEPVPFLSLRGDFDLNGPDSRQWKTTLKLPGAEKCALLKSPSTEATSQGWTFGCTYRTTEGGYERMVKSLQSFLTLPFLPDEKASINQVYFADPTRPNWRLYVAKQTGTAVGVSVVSARIAPTGSNNGSLGAFTSMPTMLPVDSVDREYSQKPIPTETQARPGNSQDCEAYQKAERQRASLEQEVRRFTIELSVLQMRYQEAIRQTSEVQQRINLSSGKSGQKGIIGTLAAVGSAADQLTLQKSQAEAQRLQLQIDQKQSQITLGQTNLMASPRNVPSPGCPTVPAKPPGELQK